MIIQEVCDRRGLCDETLFNYLDFHIYDELDPALGFEVLDGNNSEGSNITLTAHFQRRTLISLLERTRLFLQLDYNSTQLCERQVGDIGAVYTSVLREMAEQFMEPHDARPLVSSPQPVRPPPGTSDGTLEATDFLGAFRHWVARTPGALAVAHEAGCLTYQELDERSNRLAHRLRDRGLSPDSRAGICLEPSVDLLVSLLAVWKAGAAYVPLDPAHPPDRLDYIQRHAAVAVLLTTATLQKRNGFPESKVEYLDWWSDLAHYPAAPPPEVAHPENLAYVIYTSGTTGWPKGCAVSRAAFGNLLNWYRASLRTDAPVRTLILSSFGFDLAQKNLFAPLMMGGSVHLPDSPYYDARAICEQISRDQTTLVNCTPSAFFALLDAAAAEQDRALESLRHVVLGGEPIARSRLAAWLRSPWCRARVMNSYGPTECADVSASHWIEPALADDDEPVPIGRPIDGTGMAIVDKNFHPVPAGVPGELCIMGASLGRGYVNNPRLTACRFVPNRFAVAGGERLYRTGDRAKYNEDGTIEIVGRDDRQIKVRGFRIEPGEVESTLQEHPNVRWAHVALATRQSGSSRLLAYVQLENAFDGYAAELRAFLRLRVPEYMVPSAFVHLDTLPLTANGKVDRAAVLLTPPRLDTTATEFAPPRPGIEHVVAEQWCRVLDVDRIGRNENIFDAGANSLLLLTVHNRLEHVLGRRIALIELFNNPTIAAMGQYLEPSGMIASLETAAEDVSLAIRNRRAERVQARARRVDALRSGKQ